MPQRTKSFTPLETPAHFLALFDKEIFSKRISLYPWQSEILKRFSEEPLKGETNEGNVVAANDSGKSKMIIAPAILWVTTQFDKSSSVLTTASGLQLDNQSGRYIKDYARRVNSYFNKDLFTVQHRLLKFEPTNGTINLFATDEPGRAEGWHAVDYDSPLTLMMDEAKSIDPLIFEAFDRCHDVSRYLRVSSPAIGTDGSFYKFVTAIPPRGWTRKVTAYECPHIHPSKIQKIISTYGINSPVTRSIIFAEFSSVNDSTVMTYDSLMELFKKPPLLNEKDQELRVGGDLAAGGDENVIAIFKGNKQIALECFLEKDTTKTVDKIIFILAKYGVKKTSDHLNFDDGGVGHGIIDQLRKKEWNIKRVLNQGVPLDSTVFANRGAELYMNFSGFIQHEEVILINDEQLIGQLANRYWKTFKSKYCLESKKDAKAKGHKSPDRADAVVLAFNGLRAPLFSLLGNESNRPKENKGLLTHKEIVDFMDQVKFGEINRFEGKREIDKNCNLSMTSIMANQMMQDRALTFNELEDELRSRLLPEYRK